MTLNAFFRRSGWRKIWRRIATERLTEPIHVNVLAASIAAFGTLRARIALDLVVRPHNAYGILAAADQARSLGLTRVALLEFGVAAGAGLLNMADIARRVTRLTGVQFSIYGFDTGHGMPPPTDFRDHPDLYQEGDFPMKEAELRSALPGNVHLYIGEVRHTVVQFLEQQPEAAPIGYVVFDVDYYRSTHDALAVLAASNPMRYLPITLAYFDDITHPRHNPWCGELLAINEFNANNAKRKLARDAFLADRRIYRRPDWLKQIYAVHILDHPHRHRPIISGLRSLVNPYL